MIESAGGSLATIDSGGVDGLLGTCRSRSAGGRPKKTRPIDAD